MDIATTTIGTTAACLWVRGWDDCDLAGKPPVAVNMDRGISTAEHDRPTGLRSLWSRVFISTAAAAAAAAAAAFPFTLVRKRRRPSHSPPIWFFVFFVFFYYRFVRICMCPCNTTMMVHARHVVCHEFVVIMITIIVYVTFFFFLMLPPPNVVYIYSKHRLAHLQNTRVYVLTEIRAGKNDCYRFSPLIAVIVIGHYYFSWSLVCRRLGDFRLRIH